MQSFVTAKWVLYYSSNEGNKLLSQAVHYRRDPNEWCFYLEVLFYLYEPICNRLKLVRINMINVYQTKYNFEEPLSKSNCRCGSFERKT